MAHVSVRASPHPAFINAEGRAAFLFVLPSCVILAAFVSAVNLSAQLTVSTLRGTATDQTGAVVVNARIRVVNLNTSPARRSAQKWSVCYG